jgi:hypothetical protein
VAVFAPVGNQQYVITPKRTYYIAYGGQVEGLQVGVKDIGAYVEIDFTGKSQTTASVTLEENFAWGSVQFS